MVCIPEGGKTVTLLGATGSVGQSTALLLRSSDTPFTVIGVSAKENAKTLAETAISLKACYAVITEEKRYSELKEHLKGSGIEALCGEEGLLMLASRKAEVVIAAIVGAAGLKPTLKAAEHCKVLGLANKESLVCAGEILMESVRNNGTKIVPVDSEHSAIFQLLERGGDKHLQRITLTASGGPFRGWTQEQMHKVTPEQAVKHPNWLMGAKISVDSATMMNKALEIIEAQQLFALKPEQIEVLVHPESLLHGMVEYSDGSVLAQLAVTDMTVPISYALAWPERMALPVPMHLDLARAGTLTFEKVDEKNFPAMELVREVMQQGGSAPAIFNAANEVAVDTFLKGNMPFTAITKVVKETLEHSEIQPLSSLDSVLSADSGARLLAKDIISKITARAA